MTALAVRQGTPEWRAERAHGIGSSDAPIITGDAPWGDLRTLWAVKAGIIDEPQIDTPATAWGLRLEDVVAEWYAETYGVKVQRVRQLQVHRELPWMRASLDRRIVGARQLLEIKTRRFADEQWGPDGSSEIPTHYLVQVQHQLAVTGMESAVVAVLFSGSDPRRYPIPRDESLIEALIELETEFWQSVEAGTPPEPILARRRRTVVPLHDGELEADDALCGLLIRGHEARQGVKIAKEASDAIDAEVKAALEAYTGAR